MKENWYVCLIKYPMAKTEMEKIDLLKELMIERDGKILLKVHKTSKAKSPYHSPD